jgi:uncharacterized protein
MNSVFTGVGPFQHSDPRDRPAEIFGKNVTLHCGPERQSHVLLPVVPPKGQTENRLPNPSIGLTG